MHLQPHAVLAGPRGSIHPSNVLTRTKTFLSSSCLCAEEEEEEEGGDYMWHYETFIYETDP